MSPLYSIELMDWRHIPIEDVFEDVTGYNGEGLDGGLREIIALESVVLVLNGVTGSDHLQGDENKDG